MRHTLVDRPIELLRNQSAGHPVQSLFSLVFRRSSFLRLAASPLARDAQCHYHTLTCLIFEEKLDCSQSSKVSEDLKMRFFTDRMRNACNLLYFVINTSENINVNSIALNMYRLNGAQPFQYRLLCL